MVFRLQFIVEIDSQSILVAFTHRILRIKIGKTALNGIHRAYIIYFSLFFTDLLEKSGGISIGC
jgi:hypothetical protein